MRTAKRTTVSKLPGSFEALVRRMPPQAIVDDAHYSNTLEMVDRLSAERVLTRGQRLYLETLVQLVQAYESSEHPIEKVAGVSALKHLLAEHEMSAADLARLLGVHASMGSKILKGERSLTVDHLKILATRFRVRPDLFID